MCDFDDDCYDGLDWVDWMIIGPLGEQLGEEERRRREIEKDLFGEDDDYQPM